MEQYSRRFIEELANHIDPVIIDYFNKKRNLLNFSAENVAELIDETLMEYLDGKTSREDLVPIINKVKKSRLQKRSLPEAYKKLLPTSEEIAKKIELLIER